MRVLGTQIDVAVLMGARALPEKPDPEAPLSSCFVVSKANEQFSIRVAVSTTVPEPIMAAVSIDGQPLKHNYPIYPGGTRDIDGFLQSDGVTKYAFTFAAPEDASDSQAFTPLSSLLAESSARPATVADSIGRIRVQIFAATARQVLKVPEPPPPPPRMSYSAGSASASASASSLKRELGSVTPDDGQTAGKRGKVEAASSQPPADVGFTALQKPSTTETDEKKFWKNSLGTMVGPMIAGPALDAEKSGSSASASSFSGSSSSAPSTKSAPKPASTRPVLETKWELNHLLGTVTFRYSTFSGLVLSQIVKIEDPSDACMIPIDELSIHAVKVVAGVIKKGSDNGTMSIDQLGNDLATYTLHPIHAVTGGVSLREFLQRFPGNFGISASGKDVCLVASAAAPIDVNAPGLQSQLYDSSNGPRVEFVSLVAQEEAEAMAANRFSNSLETAIEIE